MRCSTSVARQLCASAVRGAGPIASTSRPVLRAARAPAAWRLQARTNVTIPHADLDPSKGTTHFVLRPFGLVANVAVVMAMVRAVEAQLGPVVHLSVPKDDDTHKPTGMVFLTLLRPHALTEPLVIETPSPTLSHSSSWTGGVSFSDVLSALDINIDGANRARRHETGSRKRGDEKATLRFQLEARKTEPIPVRARLQRVIPTAAEVAEDDAIVRALAKMDGGFFGGLAGVAEQFKHLEREVEAEVEAAPPQAAVVDETVKFEELLDAVRGPKATDGTEEDIAAVSTEDAGDAVEAAPAATAALDKSSPGKSSRADKLRSMALKAAKQAAAKSARVEAQAQAERAIAEAAKGQAASATKPADSRKTAAPQPGEDSGFLTKWFR